MKNKFLFLFFNLSFLLFSCEKELIQPEEVTESEEAISDATIIKSADGFRSNLLVEGRFEPTIESYFNIQNYTSYGFAVSNKRARKGSNALRLELRKNSEKIRSEILLAGETHRERWYGASLYLPKNDWDSDLHADGWDIITQWHAREDKGEASRFPPIALVVSKGRLCVVVYWATREKNTNNSINGKKVFDLGQLEKGKWLDMVYHIKFSHKSDGILEVWKNGVKVIKYKGPNSYNDKSLPYFKAGIYKRKWYNITKRVVYVDEVRVGNKNATYKDVAPAGSILVKPTADKPAKNKKLSLKLINANSDQLIKTITNEAILDLATLPTSNLNIKATPANAVGSILFKLTGPHNKRVIESEAPFCLFRDKNGDFHSWTPKAGNYTLTATPYSKARGGGKAGSPVTVNFKVVNLAKDGSGTPTVTMVINKNKSITSSRKAILTIKAVNATKMRFYDNSNSRWTSWEPVSSTKIWTLSKGDGSKWVKVQVRNAAGVMSQSSSDGIIL
ncbi:MAG: polysaccharide lyase, partial [Bacteroidota bacterium]|nr:polysaccharide lyase [Bacteroidota bacterium]